MALRVLLHFHHRAKEVERSGKTWGRIYAAVNRTQGTGQILLNNMKTSNASARRFCELGVIIGLILGRWFAPGALKGKELSALLLSYVGNAADILELLDSITTDGITYNKGEDLPSFFIHSIQ